MIDIKQQKVDRFKFLKKVYEKSNGSTQQFVDRHEIANELNLDRDYANDVINYLANEYLIKIISHAYIKLEHLGLKEIEEALQNVDAPTEHFLPYNVVINNYGTIQTQQVQGMQNSVSQSANSGDNKTKVFLRKYWIQIIVGVVTALISGVLLYIFGWNK